MAEFLKEIIFNLLLRPHGRQIHFHAAFASLKNSASIFQFRLGPEPNWKRHENEFGCCESVRGWGNVEGLFC